MGTIKGEIFLIFYIDIAEQQISIRHAFDIVLRTVLVLHRWYNIRYILPLYMNKQSQGSCCLESTLLPLVSAVITAPV